MVDLHLLRNVQQRPPTGTPAILTISGSPGTGKTYMIRERLSQWRVPIATMSGGDFEASYAGDPAKLLRGKLHEVAGYLEAGHLGAALVIDDLDAGLGSFGDNVAATTNRQQLISDLMHYCDEPTRVGGRSMLRVPVFATANDVTKLYGPMRRAGRMEVAAWSPDRAELVDIALGIFPSIGAPGAAELVDSHPEATPAILGEVASILGNGHLDTLLARVATPAARPDDFLGVLDAVVNHPAPPTSVAPTTAAVVETTAHVIAARRAQADFSHLAV